MTWRLVDGYAAGTTHRESNIACQDRARTRVIGTVAIAVLADGAGSARNAERGAEAVCDALLDAVASDLATRDVAALDDDAVRAWFARAHDRIAAEAVEHGFDPRDYAATGLVVVAGAEATICAQIGDGGIVVREPDAPFAVAIWPHNGEYANETYFVTDDAVETHVAIVRYGRVDDAVVFSDGVARLALDHATRDAFAPFFEPLLRTVRAAPDLEQLRGELLAYLDSGIVNARTDDDKSLAIVTRLQVERPPLLK